MAVRLASRDGRATEGSFVARRALVLVVGGFDRGQISIM
jgi:hypothetical protein